MIRQRFIEIAKFLSIPFGLTILVFVALFLMSLGTSPSPVKQKNIKGVLVVLYENKVCFSNVQKAFCDPHSPGTGVTYQVISLPSYQSVDIRIDADGNITEVVKEAEEPTQ